MATPMIDLTMVDYAKYPFMSEAAEYIKRKNLKVDEFAGDEFTGALDLAERRIREAIETGNISMDARGGSGGVGSEEQLLSYPMALMLIALAGDEWSQRRYALSEAKRASELLKQESGDRAKYLLLQIAEHTFGWRAKIVNKEIGGWINEFAVNYSDFMRNATKIHDAPWKLTNRVLYMGFVYCTQSDFARLLEEEVGAKIVSRITDRYAEAPESLSSYVERIKTLVAAKTQRYGMEEIPKELLTAAMPPCMNAILASLATGQHVPHMGRFGLTAFLANVGVPSEEIMKMFHTMTDFSERMTRYQVEHISGKRRGGKQYTPPSCKTLKTHGLCMNPDGVCSAISHPLAYYRKKARMISRRATPARTPQAPAQPAA